MGATGSLARKMVRRQLLGFAAVAVVGGLGLGVAMTAASGARRADTAYTRLRETTRAPDVYLDATGVEDRDVEALAALPEVTGAARFAYGLVAPSPMRPGVDAGALVGLDDDLLARVYRPLVISGRLPEPGATDEVLVNEALAEAGRLEPGQQVELVTGDAASPVGEATVVGVVRSIYDFGPLSGQPALLLDRAFLDAHRASVELGPTIGLVVGLRDGQADVDGFERAASQALGREVTVGGTGDDEAVNADRTLAVQSVGLAVLAGLAAAATLVAATQALSRLVDRAFADLRTLVALGVRPRQRLTLGALLALPIAAVGGVVAAGVALLASPLIPTGFARTVDPVRGIRLDFTVVGGMAGLWALALGAAGVGLAWRHRAPRDPATRAARTRRLLRQLPPRARLGAQAALLPAERDRGLLATRSPLLTVGVSVAGVAAVVTFASSSTHLLDTPRLQGWSFDAAIHDESDLTTFQQTLARLADDDAVSAVTWVAQVDLMLQGQPFEVFAFDPDGAAIHPTMRSGRPPLAEGEIVVGADLMRGAHLQIGDVVRAAGPGGEESLHVVGSATYPEVGNGDLGTGVSITRRTAQQLGADEHGSLALVRLAPGARADALAPYAAMVDGEAVTPFRGPRVRNLEQVGSLPWVLGAFLAGLGLLGVAHGLWASVRSRRRDLAVLSSIGFRPRDIKAVILWQAACIAGVGATIGLVLGIILGTRAWSTVADTTAVVDRSAIPVLTLAAVVATTFLVCTAVGRFESARLRRAGLLEALAGD